METWTVAALCRTLSLDNVLAALNSVLLERQCAVFSPNLGDLGAVTLALSTTMLRPLRWRSLTLPVMPMTERMTSLLEAPVPFVIGIQRKTSEVRRLCQELTRVNVYKDEVKLGAVRSRSCRGSRNSRACSGPCTTPRGRLRVRVATAGPSPSRANGRGPPRARSWRRGGSTETLVSEPSSVRNHRFPPRAKRRPSYSGTRG